MHRDRGTHALQHDGVGLLQVLLLLLHLVLLLAPLLDVVRREVVGPSQEWTPSEPSYQYRELDPGPWF